MYANKSSRLNELAVSVNKKLSVDAVPVPEPGCIARRTMPGAHGRERTDNRRED